MSQSKITTFFTNDQTYHKKCFIYDVHNIIAFFSDKIDPTDKFVYEVQKYELKLYLRNQSNDQINIELEKINISIPLCKSNLQKSIRRGDIVGSISSVMYMFQNDPIELFRRIPIIEVEDVCLTETFNICVWLMIAHKSYKLTNKDFENIIKIVYNLCICKEYIDTTHENKNILTLKQLSEHKNYNILLGLFYRKSYGGMKGDLNMLNGVMNNLYDNKIKIENIDKDIQLNLPIKLKLLPVSIDFHCNPGIIEIVHKNTNVDREKIKQLIWIVESAVNFRKNDTIELSENMSKDEDWLKIKKHIYSYRNYIIKISK